jgi:hypothetical protein
MAVVETRLVASAAAKRREAGTGSGLSLRRNKFCFLGRFQLESAIRQFLIDLDIRIFRESVIAALGILGIGLKKLLLH